MLVPETLSNQIKNLLDNLYNQTTDADAARQLFADQLAQLITEYIKTATVISAVSGTTATSTTIQ